VRIPNLVNLIKKQKNDSHEYEEANNVSRTNINVFIVSNEFGNEFHSPRMMFSLYFNRFCTRGFYFISILFYIQVIVIEYGIHKEM